MTSDETGRAVSQQVLVMVLAGGEGQRLHPLTRRRAKPAVRFAGQYRMIDFSLSNAVNSAYRRIYVLTQFGGTFLNSHLRKAWAPMLCDELGEYVQAAPAQKIHGHRWYEGTADAIYQNLFLLQAQQPPLVLILSGDHAYKMDYRPMVRQHIDAGADLTIASLKLPREECSPFGVLQVDENRRIISFEEKPQHPKPLPDDPDHALISMGVYLWTTEELVRQVANDATRDTSHDFGNDIVPAMIDGGRQVYAYDFDYGPGSSSAYWRDIGTIDAYWQANMELLAPDPELDLYDTKWPIYTYRESAPGAKMVGGEDCAVTDSVISPGSIISAARVESSVISPGVTIGEGARVTQSVLLDGARVAAGAVVNRAIIDEGCHIPEGFELGLDRSRDEQSFTVSDDGVAVAPAHMILEP